MTITGLLDINEIEEEISVFLKNQDILSTTVRGVTTDTDTGTWTADTSHLINKNNIRNIRSITVGGSPISFGTDYTVNYYYDDSGTYKCKISLNSAQTGDYVISYDYGSTDHIYTDFPQNQIKISSYPRISVQVTNVASKPDSVDKYDTRSDLLISIYVYAAGRNTLNTYVKDIREAILDAKTDFYYIPFLSVYNFGPILPQPNRGDKIFSRVIELRGLFKMEVES